MTAITDILYNSNCNNTEKQIIIEKNLIEYEINYFNEVEKKSDYNLDMKILHKYFKKMEYQVKAYTSYYEANKKLMKD